MKPILFNTKMVKAILEGEKTVTRRVLKLPSYIKKDSDGTYSLFAEGECYDSQNILDLFKERYLLSPYQVGDILYVRETWQPLESVSGELMGYHYNADGLCIWLDGDMTQDLREPMKWKPSIHMPKEAARIFLKVTDVRAERLQDIVYQDLLKEGMSNDPEYSTFAIKDFKYLWDKTATKLEAKWDVNPWVWVIEFEKADKPNE